MRLLLSFRFFEKLGQKFLKNVIKIILYNFFQKQYNGSTTHH